MRVDNAIIIAAGTSSRFAPLSFERHKALIDVKGEILIERQIKQLIDASIKDIYIVVGYKAEQFDYLKDKYNIKLLKNDEYRTRNNNASIWVAKDVICNSYICSSDNYFAQNPFEKEVESAYYAAEYSELHTNEWCMTEDKKGYISSVTIGGEKAWYMMGHTFWDSKFSSSFLKILSEEYDLETTKSKLWESIFAEHLDELKMKIKKYQSGVIFEFDTLDELRLFDSSYIKDTRSNIIKRICCDLKVSEEEVKDIKSFKTSDNEASGFEFETLGHRYRYYYSNGNFNKI